MLLPINKTLFAASNRLIIHDKGGIINEFPTDKLVRFPNRTCVFLSKHWLTVYIPNVPCALYQMHNIVHRSEINVDETLYYHINNELNALLNDTAKVDNYVVIFRMSHEMHAVLLRYDQKNGIFQHESCTIPNHREGESEIIEYYEVLNYSNFYIIIKKKNSQIIETFVSNSMDVINSNKVPLKNRALQCDLHDVIKEPSMGLNRCYRADCVIIYK
jgi:hypothetical protein